MIPHAMQTLKAEFALVFQEFGQTPAMKILQSGRLTVAHYKSYLRQVFHYTRDNPQIQALAATYFRGSDRAFVKMFYKHASQEIGHDLMALADLAALGEDTSRVPIENPLPATAALNGFVFTTIYNRNPIGYLGYLFFLEFLPTSSGEAYMVMLERIGVPRKAMTFLQEHATVDVHHNRMMEHYAARLIRTAGDMSAVIYTMKATAKLYADMLLAAIEQADCHKDWGIADDEAVRWEPSAELADAAE